MGGRLKTGEGKADDPLLAGGAELELFEPVPIEAEKGLGLEVLVGSALPFRVQPQVKAADVFVRLNRGPMPGFPFNMVLGQPLCRPDGINSERDSKIRERFHELTRSLVDLRSRLRAPGCGTSEKDRCNKTEGEQ